MSSSFSFRFPFLLSFFSISHSALFSYPCLPLSQVHLTFVFIPLLFLYNLSSFLFPYALTDFAFLSVQPILLLVTLLFTPLPSFSSFLTPCLLFAPCHFHFHNIAGSFSSSLFFAVYIPLRLSCFLAFLFLLFLLSYISVFSPFRCSVDLGWCLLEFSFLHVKFPWTFYYKALGVLF